MYQHQNQYVQQPHKPQTSNHKTARAYVHVLTHAIHLVEKHCHLVYWPTIAWLWFAHCSDIHRTVQLYTTLQEETKEKEEEENNKFNWMHQSQTKKNSKNLPLKAAGNTSITVAWVNRSHTMSNWHRKVRLNSGSRN